MGWWAGGRVATAAVAVRELGEGRVSVLAIEGEAGIGKTRLVQSIVKMQLKPGHETVELINEIRAAEQPGSVEDWTDAG
jgi:chromosomal replication initiation ATPase DnaA